MLKKTFYSASALALILGVAGGSAVAQSLDEIVVTAQKRAESLSDVPISIAAVTGDTLENRSIDDLSSLSQSMPNVTINENQIDSTISVRGVTTGNNKGFEQSVAMYFDGISYGRSQLIRTPLVDLERVEVLRGPQPTLFGKNAIAGAISVISAKPTKEFEGKISVSYEMNHEEPQLLGVLSGPLSDTLSARLTVSHRQLDGWIVNTHLNRKEPQRDEDYLRAQLAWDDGGPLTVNLKVEHAEFDSYGYPMENLNANDFYNNSPFSLFRSVDTVEDWARGSGEVSSKNELDNFVLTANYDWNDHTITSITGYVEYDTFEILDVDYTHLDVLDGTNQSEAYEQFSQEFRIASPGGERLDYIAGIFYQDDDLKVTDNVFIGEFARILNLGILTDTQWARKYDQSSERWSIFAQGDYDITEQLNLTVGARYTKEDKKGQRVLDVLGTDGQTGSVPLKTTWAVALNVFPHDLQGDREESSFDPLVRLQYDVNDNVAIHASFTEGSKAGGFDIRSNSAPTQTPLNPAAAPGAFEFEGEEAENYEIGAKMNWDRAQINVTVFQTDYNDLQTNIFDGVLGFFVKNASTAEVEGIEIDGRFLVSEGLEIYGGAAYLDYTYTDFKDSQCGFGETPNNGAFCDRSGYTAPYAPEYTANFGIDYETTLANDMVLDININADYSSEYFLATNLDANLQEDGYTKLGAQIGLAGGDGTWRLSVIGDNLTDERIRVIGGTLPLAKAFTGGNGIAYDALYARPRNITFKLDYNF